MYHILIIAERNEGGSGGIGREWFGASGTPVDVPNNDELPGRPIDARRSNVKAAAITPSSGSSKKAPLIAEYVGVTHWWGRGYVDSMAVSLSSLQL